MDSESEAAALYRRRIRLRHDFAIRLDGLGHLASPKVFTHVLHPLGGGTIVNSISLFSFWLPLVVLSKHSQIAPMVAEPECE